LFYVLFSAAIVLPMSRALPVVTFGLLLLVLAGAWVESTQTALYFWTRPIVLEFAFGSFIAWMWIRNFRLTMSLSMLILLAAVALVVVDPWGLLAATAGTSTPNDLVRVMGWGLPAAAVLAAAVLLVPSGRSTPRSLSPLVTLGDWSYALYLTHTFALIVVVKAWKLLELQSVFGALALAVVQVAAAVIVAGLVYRWFELPVTTALRRRFC
jgi:peptidoglycan/LPS O-acetylase OafA/YrhL